MLNFDLENGNKESTVFENHKKVSFNIAGKAAF